MNALTPEIKKEALSDRSPVLRKAMVQMIETKLPDQLELLISLEKERDPRVAEQLVFTLGTLDHPEAEEMIQSLASNHLSDKGVMLATTVSLWGKKHLPLIDQLRSGKAFAKLPQSKKASVNMDWDKALSSWDRGMKFAKDFDVAHRKMIQTGEQLYFQHCTSCHGADGQGVQIPGTEQYLAPSLVESKRVHGDPEQLIPLFFHGLMGPIDGKTYQAGYMAPAKTFGIEREDRLADLITYLRYAWGKEGGHIDKSDITSIRRKYEKRTVPWTDEELKSLR